MQHEIPLPMQLTLAIERSGWARKERIAGVTRWQVLNERLLAGLRTAAERSLAKEGHSSPLDVLEATLAAYQGNEFLAYRSLLSEGAMRSLIKRFEEV